MESYGKILAEYTLKIQNTNTDKFLELSGQEILDNIKKLKNQPYSSQAILIISN